MSHPKSTDEAKIVVDLIIDAGGKIIGRTKLQKIAYFLEIAGLGDGLKFTYRHYGPYSEELASAVRHARALDLIKEEECTASWGGRYSVFTCAAENRRKSPKARKELATLAIAADSIELELAATAAYVALAGEEQPWAETEKRKPDKAGAGRLDKAKELYSRFRAIETPKRLPDIKIEP